MIKRLKEIEKELMGIYAEVKKEIPNLEHLSFEITAYELGKINLSGFYFISGGCYPYNNIAELATLVTETKGRRVKNEILYQRFERII
jgi:hypothetical protein